jgi:hypothetical protein
MYIVTAQLNLNTNWKCQSNGLETTRPQSINFPSFNLSNLHHHLWNNDDISKKVTLDKFHYSLD